MEESENGCDNSLPRFLYRTYKHDNRFSKPLQVKENCASFFQVLCFSLVINKHTFKMTNRGQKKFQFRPQQPEESGKGNSQLVWHLVSRKVLWSFSYPSSRPLMPRFMGLRRYLAITRSQWGRDCVHRKAKSEVWEWSKSPQFCLLPVPLLPI